MKRKENEFRYYIRSKPTNRKHSFSVEAINQLDSKYQALEYFNQYLETADLKQNHMLFNEAHTIIADTYEKADY